jgi:hypothetical protein
MSVGHTVAVNIDFCDFLALVLSELYGYSTPLTTLMVKKVHLFHRPVLILQYTANSGVVIKAPSGRTVLVIWKKKAQLLSLRLYRYL